MLTNTPLLVRLGRRLRASRERAGFTQERMAQLLGVHVSTVRRAESGATLPEAWVLAGWELKCGFVLV